MVFGRFSALHPTRRQATPRGLAFRGPRGFGHGLTFGRKSSEFERGCHWGALPVNFGDPQLEPLLAQYFNAWSNSSRLLPFVRYSFVRSRKMLRTAPAMVAGVTKRLWEIGDMVDVLEASERANNGR